ncbi:hypothetical protein [Dyella sedimenti]|uniref:hypothetical protein n=1 Tax=Dyella sedimenti TaxID=2919947 RepID=UPI001FAAA290|nr:hypothetical protein [Dyella sedimenti]
MAHTNVTCTHKACLCEVSDPGMFCSDYCKEAWDDNLDDPVCKCGHSACMQSLEDGTEDPMEGPV